MSTVFFDLETGGLDPERHPIIQIAAIAVDDDYRELETWERKVRFKVESADAEALAMNSYDAETWDLHAIPPLQAFRELCSLLSRHGDWEMVSRRSGARYRVAVLAGHNAAAFDGPFLFAWQRRLQQAYPNERLFLPARWLVLDTLQHALWCYRRTPQSELPPSFKLGDLCRHLGVDLPEEYAHDALADVRATAQLAAALHDFRSEVRDAG